jgi:Ras-related protein Rab-1A
MSYYSSEINYKLVIIGDSGVGKTRIIDKLGAKLVNCLPKSIMDTSQTYFYKQRFKDKNLGFFIFDVWGDENAISRYLDQTNSIIIVYDVSDYKTCKSNNKWLTLLRKNIGNSRPIIVLAANKCDLTQQKLTNISIKDGKTFADDNKLLFMETSALNNINIYEMFTLIAKELIRTKNCGISDVNSIIEINECSNDHILLKEKAQRLKYKVILLGDSGVGKTSLTKTLISNKFNEKYSTTINVEFYRHEEFIDNNTKIKFDIWDTCGSERFNTLNAFYYRNSDAVILMYDISDKNTFDDLQMWTKQLEQYVEDYRDLFIAIVGAKYDLIDSRQVKYEKAKSFAEQNQYLFMETSAKTGRNVRELFNSMAKAMYSREIQGKRRNEVNIGESQQNIRQKHIMRLNSKEIKPNKKNCCN